jgi:hypothetical protein
VVIRRQVMVAREGVFRVVVLVRGAAGDAALMAVRVHLREKTERICPRLTLT